ncbi:branched-chain amino acid transporter permease [Eremococcus coleocola]|uniref:branched-chain amino acid transporter permease n=1 Tax=Eremococcus coleocola TaxID=88132 RepID=UPI00055172D5|nr:AzlD domain-containing protein [Eremococcus coleocola]
MMTNSQVYITITLITLVTALIRFLPFIIFPANRKPPLFIQYLGTVLPMAAISLLMVYALKDTVFLTSPHGIPQICAVIALFFVHKWKRNTLLSIATGTFVYMFIIQVFF